jgi:hydrogenase expression/formation protein HypC
MCLGVPGKVVEINTDGPLRMARIDFGGVRKEACLEHVPDVEVGEYVIVHVGFAISKVDEEEALRTLELLRMIDELALGEELGAMPDVLDAPDDDAAAGATA